MNLLNNVSIRSIADIPLLGDYTKEYAWFPEAASTFCRRQRLAVRLYLARLLCLFRADCIRDVLLRRSLSQTEGCESGKQRRAQHAAGIAWSIGPSFFLVGMFVLGAKSYLDHRTVPDGANEMEVKSQKWFWSVHYGRGTYHPELHILVNEPTKLSMTSTDVLHSLYIPAFRAKKDIVPGRYNYMWFKPTVANEKVSDEELAKALKETEESGGEWSYDKRQFTPDGYRFYDLFCAEYCGTDHSRMQTVVVVHETLEDLNAWIKKYSKRTTQTPVQYGESLYKNRGCKGCHSIDGTRRTGPSFKESFGNQRPLASGETVVADANYIRESILNPKAKVVNSYSPAMPSFKGQLTEDDLFCLVEYLKSVSDYTPTKRPRESKPAESGDEENKE